LGVYGIGRPANPNVRVFQRNIDDGQRAILLAAGNGDMSAGWLEVLDTYQHLYSLGFRPGMAFDHLVVLLPTGDQKNAPNAR
jgi:hypothetical protein